MGEIQRNTEILLISIIGMGSGQQEINCFKFLVVKYHFKD